MHLLGLTGLKQSGKDTVLKCIRELMPNKLITRVNFADTLKAEVANACGVEVDYIDANKEHFRLILQGWGTDFRRQLYGEDYWLIRWANSVNRLVPTPHILVVTDVRFLNEAGLVRTLNGIVWRVVRAHVTSDLHQSETEQNSIKVDATIINSSSLDNLKQQTKTLLEQHGLHTTK